MNAIARAIQIEGLTGQPADVSKAFVDDVVISTDSTRWSYQGVAERHGTEVAGTILVLLETATNDESLPLGLRATLRAELASFQLGSTDGKTGGLDMSRPERQLQMSQWVTMLTEKGQSAAAGAVSLVMRLGVVRGPRWKKHHDITEAPTEEQCADALQRIATQQKWAQAANEIVPAMLTAGNTWAEIVAALRETV